ncbi:MAG: hypothetical protein Ta2F_02270 [Termitinemataceae bacterium]|nr:MAG: hypothetical protein Ta2F_02270 [Termitinemataceae bacterium]
MMCAPCLLHGQRRQKIEKPQTENQQELPNLQEELQVKKIPQISKGPNVIIKEAIGNFSVSRGAAQKHYTGDNIGSVGMQLQLFDVMQLDPNAFALVEIPMAGIQITISEKSSFSIEWAYGEKNIYVLNLIYGRVLAKNTNSEYVLLVTAGNSTMEVTEAVLHADYTLPFAVPDAVYPVLTVMTLEGNTIIDTSNIYTKDAIVELTSQLAIIDVSKKYAKIYPEDAEVVSYWKSIVTRKPVEPEPFEIEVVDKKSKRKKVKKKDA